MGIPQNLDPAKTDAFLSPNQTKSAGVDELLRKYSPAESQAPTGKNVDALLNAFSQPDPVTTSPDRIEPKLDLHSYQSQGFGQPASTSFDMTAPDVFNKLLAGFSKQESGNNYAAVGPPTKYGKALGKYQITESEVKRLAGILDTPADSAAFLASPDAQEKAMRQLMKESVEKYGGSIEDVILAHYGGPKAVKGYHDYLAGKLSNFDRVPKGKDGKPLWIGPSHKDYLAGVMANAGFGPSANALNQPAPASTMLGAPMDAKVQAEEIRREKLRVEKAQVIERIQTNQVSSLREDKRLTKKLRQRLFDIDSALTDAPAKYPGAGAPLGPPEPPSVYGGQQVAAPVPAPVNRGVASSIAGAGAPLGPPEPPSVYGGQQVAAPVPTPVNRGVASSIAGAMAVGLTNKVLPTPYVPLGPEVPPSIYGSQQVGADAVTSPKSRLATAKKSAVVPVAEDMVTRQKRLISEFNDIDLKVSNAKVLLDGKTKSLNELKPKLEVQGQALKTQQAVATQALTELKQDRAQFDAMSANLKPMKLKVDALARAAVGNETIMPVYMQSLTNYNKAIAETQAKQDSHNKMVRQVNAQLESVKKAEEQLNGQIEAYKVQQAESNKFAEGINAQIERSKVISEAFKQYGVHSPAKWSIEGWAKNLALAATSFLNLGGASPTTAPFVIAQKLMTDQGRKELAKDLDQYTELMPKAILDAPKAFTRTAANGISMALGNGPIDDSVWQNDRLTQGAETVTGGMVYFIPGVQQALMVAQVAAIAKGLSKDPGATISGVIDGLNPFAKEVYDEDIQAMRPLREEERGVRAVGLLLAALGGKKLVSDLSIKNSLMSKYGFTFREAGMILDFSQTAVKRASKLSGENVFTKFVQDVKGTRLGKMADLTGQMLDKLGLKYVTSENTFFDKGTGQWLRVKGQVSNEGPFINMATEVPALGPRTIDPTVPPEPPPGRAPAPAGPETPPAGPAPASPEPVAPVKTPEVASTPTPEVALTPTPKVASTPTPEVALTPTPKVASTPTPEVALTPTPKVAPDAPIVRDAPVVPPTNVRWIDVDVKVNGENTGFQATQDGSRFLVKHPDGFVEQVPFKNDLEKGLAKIRVRRIAGEVFAPEKPTPAPAPVEVHPLDKLPKDGSTISVDFNGVKSAHILTIPPNRSALVLKAPDGTTTSYPFQPNDPASKSQAIKNMRAEAKKSLPAKQPEVAEPPARKFSQITEYAGRTPSDLTTEQLQAIAENSRVQMQTQGLSPEKRTFLNTDFLHASTELNFRNEPIKAPAVAPTPAPQPKPPAPTTPVKTYSPGDSFRHMSNNWTLGEFNNDNTKIEVTDGKGNPSLLSKDRAQELGFPIEWPGEKTSDLTPKTIPVIPAAPEPKPKIDAGALFDEVAAEMNQPKSGTIDPGALFDEVAAEIGAKAPEPKATPTPQTPTTREPQPRNPNPTPRPAPTPANPPAATDNGGIVDANGAIDKLKNLFGSGGPNYAMSPSRKGFSKPTPNRNQAPNVPGNKNPGFNQRIYDQAVPSLIDLWQVNVSPAMPVEEIKNFARQFIQLFGIPGKPYFEQFFNDINNGVINPYANNSSESSGLATDQQASTGEAGSVLGPDIRGPGGSGAAVRGDGVVGNTPVGNDEPRGESPVGAPDKEQGSRPRGTTKNYVITDDEQIGNSGIAKKKNELLEAIKVVKDIEATNRAVTEADQRAVAQFPGWGWTGNMLNTDVRDNGTSASTDPEFLESVRSLLTPAEFESASNATTNSHFTSIEVIDAHWDIVKRLGLKNGLAIESSAGSGSFLGRAPKGFNFTAVELDSLSAKILKILYPEESVIAGGFEDVKANEKYDLMISNVPFGNVGIGDYEFEKKVEARANKPTRKAVVKSIHNYFIAKGLDHLKPGGLMVVTTSSFTMNGSSADARLVREYIYSQADLVEAIRLPESAFKKVAATDVVTDILVFRKRKPGEKPGGHPFIKTVTSSTPEGDPILINEYFATNPAMVLGIHSMKGTMYPGKDSYTVLPEPNRTLQDQLNQAIKLFPANIVNSPAPLEQSQQNVLPPKDLKTWNIFEHNKNFYVKTGQFDSEPIIYDNAFLTDKRKDQLRKYLKVRESSIALIEANKTVESDNELKPFQASLKKAYDDYFKVYGRFLETVNRKLLMIDAEWPSVFALENTVTEIVKYDKDGDPVFKEKFVSLASIFTQRVASYIKIIDKVPDAASALIASLNNLAKVDLNEMVRVSGMSKEKLLADLSTELYQDPVTKEYVTKSEYGSGNVVQKLKDAKAKVDSNPQYQVNVDFLETVQPEPMTTRQIRVALGSNYIPIEIVQEFFNDYIGNGIKIKYNPELNLWTADGNYPDAFSIRWDEIVRGERPDGSIGEQRISSVLSFRDVVAAVFKNSTVEAKYIAGYNDKKPILKHSKEGSQLGNAAAARMKKAWDNYWRHDPEFSKILTDIYNNKINVIRRRVYDGSFLTMPGMATERYGKSFALNPHQKDAIWRGVTQDFALMAHGVGAGKTFEMIGIASLLKTTGKRQKPLMIVKNETVNDIFKAINEMYPGSSVLFFSPDEMNKENRQELMGRIATGSYDFILMGHSTFELLPVSEATYMNQLNQAMQDLRDKIASVGYGQNFDPYRTKINKEGKEVNDSPTTAQIEKEFIGSDKKEKALTVKRLMRMMQQLAAKHKRRMQKALTNQYNGMTFEQLGIDHVLVDESHMYKNMSYASEAKGMGSVGSDRANDLQSKLRYIRSQSGGATFFSGTPIVNSIDELYTQFNILTPELLEAQGMQSFDDWLRAFGEVVQNVEQDLAGRFKFNTRIAKYINQAQLVNNFWDMADVKRTEDLPSVKRPAVVDEQGNVTNAPIVLESYPDEYLNSFSMALVARAEGLAGQIPGVPGQDILLSIGTDAQKAATSMMLIDPSLPESENSKINQTARKIAEIYKMPKVQQLKGTQVVFLDMGTPKNMATPKPNLYFSNISEESVKSAIKKIVEKGYEYIVTEIVDDEGDITGYDVEPDLTPSYNLYSDFKDKLVALGIPEKEIIFGHSATNRQQKVAQFARMNSGEVRVMITSTALSGTGVNIQERLFALHHMNAPWTPAEIEQREGRINRQGNIWADHGGIRIYNHITVGTFDSFRWNVLLRKLIPILQMMKGDISKSEIDVEELSEVEMFQEQAARAAGRPEVLQYIILGRELANLQLEKDAFDTMQKRIKRNLDETSPEIQKAKYEIPDAIKKDAIIKRLQESYSVANNAKDFVLIPVGGEEPTTTRQEVFDIIKAKVSNILATMSYDGSRSFSIGKFGELDITGVLDRRMQKGELYYGLELLAESYSLGIPRTRIYGSTYEYYFREAMQGRERVADFMSRITRSVGNLATDNEAILRKKIFEIELEKESLQKKVDQEWDKLEELENLFKEWSSLDNTVGDEVRNGQGAGWGELLEDDPLPPNYWANWLQVKRDRAAIVREAKEARLREKQQALDDLKRKLSEKKPLFAMSPPSGGGSATPSNPTTPTGSNFRPTVMAEGMDKWKLLRALYKVFSPALLGADARRMQMYLRSQMGEQAMYEAGLAHMLEDLQRMFDKAPKEDAYAFIDAIEAGELVDQGNKKVPKKFLTPKAKQELTALGWPSEFTIQDAANFIREELDNMRETIQQVDPTKLKNYYENYFPHIWKDPKQAHTWLEKWFKDNALIDPKTAPRGSGKRPLEGSMAAFKKRSYPTLADGLAAGLEPVSSNPVDLFLLTIRQLNKFILAKELLAETDNRGQRVYVPFNKRPPANYAQVESKAFDVYSPGEITVKFTFDQKMFDSLINVADKLGVDVKYVKSVARGKTGQTVWGQQAGSKILLKYGANLEVLSHEIGHAVDAAVDLKKLLLAGPVALPGNPATESDVINSEMNSLAELRYESQTDIDPAYEMYVKSPEEKIGNFIHLYIHAKELLEQFAPTSLKVFNDLKAANTTLQLLDTVRRGPEIGSMENTYKVFGRTYTGRYYVPENVAQVINNKLSPGISGSDIELVRNAYNGIKSFNNTLNAIQLGFDGFHALTMSINVAMTEMSAGIGFLEAGFWGKGLRKAFWGLTLVKPIFYGFKRGKEIKKAMLEGSTDPAMQQLKDLITMAGGRVAPDAVYMNDFRRQWRIAVRDLKNAEDLRKKHFLGVPAKRFQMAFFAMMGTVEASSAWLMEDLVPTLKLYAFEMELSAELAKLEKQKPMYTKEDEMATTQRAWDSIDNRMGQLVYDNLFWNNAVKHMAHILFRAFGWAFGTVREIGGAVVDTGGQIVGGVKKLGGGAGGNKPPKGPGGGAGAGEFDSGPFMPKGLTPRQRYAFFSQIVIHCMVAMLLQYILTGKRPEETMDLLFPKNGRKNADGSAQRLSIPSYIKDSLNWVTAPLRTIGGKLAPWISVVGGLVTNRDFGGVQVKNPNDDFAIQGVQVAMFIANQFIPIAYKPSSPFDDSGLKLGPMRISAWRFIGSTPAPAWASRTPAVNKAYALLLENLSQAPRTEEKDVVRKARVAIQQNIFDMFEADATNRPKDGDKYQKAAQDLATKYPTAAENAMDTLWDKHTQRMLLPIERAIANLKVEQVIEVHKLANDFERDYVDLKLAMWLSRKIDGGKAIDAATLRKVTETLRFNK